MSYAPITPEQFDELVAKDIHEQGAKFLGELEKECEVGMKKGMDRTVSYEHANLSDIGDGGVNYGYCKAGERAAAQRGKPWTR